MIKVWVFWRGDWIHTLLPTSVLSYQCLHSQWEYFITVKKTNLLTTEVVSDRSKEGGDGEEAGLCVRRKRTNLSCYQVDIVNELDVEYFIVCRELDMDSLVI